MNHYGRAVTFDFHDTLAHCDPWFELEVRTLASAWLRWRGFVQADPPRDALLVNADAAYRRLREEIVDHGCEQTAEQCVAAVLHELGEPAPPAAIDAGVEHLMREAFAEARPVPGAIETVRTLAASGVTLGVVSSAVHHPFLEWTLTSFGIRDAFAEVVTSASAGYYKSRPEIYWHALERIDVRPDRTVHVGDSWRWDVGMARQAGLRAVWLRKSGADPGDGPEPDLTLDTLMGAGPRILDLLDDGGGR
jgi:HAD superfamily hydrolase (TIGR01509 family)